MDVLELARVALAASPAARGHATRALEFAKAGQLDAAAEALAALSHNRRHAATCMIELVVQPEPATLADALAGAPPVDPYSTHLTLVERWVRALGCRRGPAAVRTMVGRSDAGVALQWAAHALCDAGEAEAAVPFVEELDPMEKVGTAWLWARIGVLRPEGRERDDALQRAAAAGDHGQQIQDGGEEAEAHGRAIATMAAGGVNARHRAIARAMRSLLRLARSRARRDARSDGVALAAVAAASRAEADLDRGWLHHAAELHGRIWTESVQHPVSLRLAWAESALGRDPSAHLARIPDSAFGHGTLRDAPREVLRALLDDGGRPGAVLRAVKAVGGDLDQVATELVGSTSGLYDQRHLHIALLELGHPLASKLETTGATRAVAAARRGHADPELASALTPTDVFLLGDALDADLADALVAHFLTVPGTTGEQGLLSVATASIGRDPDRAVGLLDSGPAASAEPWVPYIRRTAPPPSAAAPDPDADPTTLDAVGLVALARHRAAQGDSEGVVALIKPLEKVKSGRSANDRAVKAHQLALLHLLAGDLNGAVGVASPMPQCSVPGHGAPELASEAAVWLDAQGGELTTDAAVALIKLLSKGPAQDVAAQLTAVAAATLHRVEPAGRDTVVQTLTDVAGSVLTTTPGDLAALHAGLGTGWSRLGDGERAHAEFTHALAAYDAPQLDLVHHDVAAAIAHATALAPEQRAGHLDALLDRLAGLTWPSETAQVEALERVAVALQTAGAIHALPRHLASGRLPSSVVRELRRSLWALAASGPAPVDTLLAAWPDPMPPSLGREAVEALAAALAAEGRPEAEAIAELL